MFPLKVLTQSTTFNPSNTCLTRTFLGQSNQLGKGPKMSPKRCTSQRNMYKKVPDVRGGLYTICTYYWFWYVQNCVYTSIVYSIVLCLFISVNVAMRLHCWAQLVWLFAEEVLIFWGCFDPWVQRLGPMGHCIFCGGHEFGAQGQRMQLERWVLAQQIQK